MLALCQIKHEFRRIGVIGGRHIGEQGIVCRLYRGKGRIRGAVRRLVVPLGGNGEDLLKITVIYRF
jgi:hypothetical protein